ncbi:MAG: hypothetical protein ACI87W_001842 [Halieaceae bacterium]|jgi:hypothetical protein
MRICTILRKSFASAPLGALAIAACTVVAAPIVADGHEVTHGEGPGDGEVAPLDAFPVWRTMDGLWRGELDSFGPDGDHKIRAYNALFRIQIDAKQFRQTNWMYYGEKHAARRNGLSRGLAREGEAVELITNTYGEAVGDKGSMKVTLIDHMFDYKGGELTRVISDFAVVYEYFNPESGALQHLQLNNLGVPNRRIRSAQGIHAKTYLSDPATGEKMLDEQGEPVPNPDFGKPRSASFYREERVEEARLEEYRAEFQQEYNVKVRVEAGATPDDPSRIYRLDAVIEECDWLANHPYDPWRVTAGIAAEDVDTAAAIPACVDAATRRPGEPRYQYQAGRSLFYAGRTEEALPYLYRAAVEMDYPQAQYVLGYLKDVGLQGVSVDTCGAGRLWRRAALQGLFYAQYSVAKWELEGRYKSCDWHGAPGETLSFLESAYTKSAYTGFEDEIAGLIEQVKKGGAVLVPAP